MIFERTWFDFAGREAVRALASGSCGNASDARELVQAGVNAVAMAGADPAALVRSRVWARSRELRRIGSDARLEGLAGERRAASASFIAPERLAPGIDLAIDLTALMQTGDKEIAEYEPRIAPPRYVRAGGLVFLSGNTDISERFETQLETICRNIDASLAIAGARRERIRIVSAFIHSSVDGQAARRALSDRFPTPVTTTTVEGYSAPEKLIEIEVTAEG